MLMMGSYTYALKKRVMSDGGQLSNEEAASFCTELVEGGTESILLAHLSKENNFPENPDSTDCAALRFSAR